MLDFIYVKMLVEIMLDSSLNENLLKRKMQALNGIIGRARLYLKDGFMEKVVFAAAEKKLQFLTKAKTIQEIEGIEKLSLPRYNGNGFVPDGEYHIEEEELILWSRTSLQAPLNNEGTDRYLMLFNKYLPEYTDQIA